MLAHWKMTGEGEYVCGLEPSTHAMTPTRREQRENGSLRDLAPGESVSFRLEIGALPDADAIAAFEKGSAVLTERPSPGGLRGTRSAPERGRQTKPCAYPCPYSPTSWPYASRTVPAGAGAWETRQGERGQILNLEWRLDSRLTDLTP